MLGRTALNNNKSVPMTITSLFRYSIGLAALFVSFARAQEGHPMSGVWVGDWTPQGEQQQRVVVVLDWLGTELAGTINPGPKATPIRNATVNPADWSLHFEADAANGEGKSVHYVIDGKLDDLGTYNRSLAGTWTVDGKQGTFSITRQ